MRDEKGLQRSLFKLWGTDAGAVPANAALFRQLPSSDPAVGRLAAETQRRLAWLPSNSPGPDFGLVDPRCPSTGRNRIRLVAEIKAGAPANWPFARSVLRLPVLRGGEAQRISEAYGAEPTWNWAQIDAYRARRWWRLEDACTMEDPEDVVWVFMDLKGRSASNAFLPTGGAVAPELWHSLDLREFAADLRELRVAGSWADETAVALKNVIERIDVA